MRSGCDQDWIRMQSECDQEYVLWRFVFSAGRPSGAVSGPRKPAKNTRQFVFVLLVFRVAIFRLIPLCTVYWVLRTGYFSSFILHLTRLPALSERLV